MMTDSIERGITLTEETGKKVFEALFGEVDLKSTQGLKKNMKNEIDNLERKAYREGFADGQEDTVASEEYKASLRGEGVLAIWNRLNELVDEKYGAYSSDDGELIAYEIDTEDFTNWMMELLGDCPFEVLGLECEDCHDYEPKVGDIVLDKAGHKCTVTNTDAHIHVIYPNGKTKKWDKTDEFTPTGERAQTVIGCGEIKEAH